MALKWSAATPLLESIPNLSLEPLPKPIVICRAERSEGLEARFFAAHAAQDDSLGKFRDDLYALLYRRRKARRELFSLASC